MRFFNQSNIGVISHKINGTGKILPRKQIIKLGTPLSPNNVAAISPPLNSNIGNNDIINTNISSNFNIGIYTFITVFIHFVFVMRFSKIVFLIKKGILFI